MFSDGSKVDSVREEEPEPKARATMSKVGRAIAKCKEQQVLLGSNTFPVSLF